MAVTTNLFVEQGSTFTSIIFFNNENGNPNDLSGFTASGSMRRSYNSANSIPFSSNITDAANGEITLSLSPATTANLKSGRYVYDVEVFNGSQTVRVLEGLVVVSPGVTRGSTGGANANIFLGIQPGAPLIVTHGGQIPASFVAKNNFTSTGNAYLRFLKDVEAPALQNNHVLIYNSNTDTFQSKEIVLGIHTLGDYVSNIAVGGGLNIAYGGESVPPNISLQISGVTPGSYGSNNYASQIVLPTFTIDGFGRVTHASSISLSNLNLLERIKTVDGPGSGLDADYLHGIPGNAFITASGLTTENVTEVVNLYFSNVRTYANVEQIGYAYNNYVNARLLTKANVSDLTTSNTLELNNLYFTNARVYANVEQIGYAYNNYVNSRVDTKANVYDLTTANVLELNNLYFTNARVYANILDLGFTTNAYFNSRLNTSNVVEGSNLYFTNERVYANVEQIGYAYNAYVNSRLITKANVVDLNTSNVAEGSNLYFTNARSRSALSNSTGVYYDTLTGVLSIGQAVDTTSDVQFNNVTVSGSLFSNDITADEVVIHGNLVVRGSTTTVDTEEISLSDNKIVLNSNLTGAPLFDAGFVVNRGNEANVELIFDETTDAWKFTNNGNVFYLIPTSTSDLIEGANLYFTNARVYANVLDLGYTTNAYVNIRLETKANVSDLNTSNVVEGANLYFTDARVYANVEQIGYAYNSYVNSRLTTKANVSDLTTANVVELNNLYFTNARVYSNVVELGYATNAYVNARVDTKANVSDLNTGNVIEGANLYFTNERVYANVEQIGYAYNTYVNSRLTTKANVADLNTSNVTEGNNLYFTNARVYANVEQIGYAYNTYVNARLTTKANVADLNTSNVAEGTNLYFTNARSRSAISVLDLGGDGQLSYNETTGVISYTGPNALDVRAHLSAGTGVYYNNSSGVISIGQSVDTTANVIFHNVSVNGTLYSDDITANQVVIEGNLFVRGNTTYLNANEVTIADNKITLNGLLSNVTVPTLNSGIIVNRGFEANVELLWDEVSNVWKFTNNGTNYYLIPTSTTDLIEGANLYYTPERVYANVEQIGYAYNTYVNSRLTTKANVADLNTSNVAEGSNLYFTNARVYSNVIELGYATNAYVNARVDTKANIYDLTTANVAELNNLYFTNARVYSNVLELGYSTNTYVNTRLETKANVSDLNTSNVVEGNNLYFTNARVYSNVLELGYSTNAYVNARLETKANVADLNTSNVAEGANLYFTTARARDSISVIGTGSYDNATGVITIVGGVTNVAGVSGSVSNAQILDGVVSAGINTSNIVEGANLYFTNERVYANVEQIGYAYNTYVNSRLTTKANVADLNTSNVAEGSNLYFTNTRAISALSAGQNIVIAANGLITAAVSELSGNTDIVPEGTTNLYFTNTRAISALTAGQNISIAANGLIVGAVQSFNGNTDVVAEGVNNLYFTNARVYANVLELDYATNAYVNARLDAIVLNTSNVVEGANLYFTNARVYANVLELDYATNAYVNARLDAIVLNTSNVVEGANLYYTNARVYANVLELGYATNSDINARFDAIVLNTSNVVEGANLYFTNTRAYEAVANTALTLNSLTVTGNLTVLGNALTVSSNTLVVEDPLIQLGFNNPGDSVDLGFIGHYNDGIERHAGLFRDASDGKFKFFDNYEVEPGGQVIDTSNASFRLASISANIFEGNVVGTVSSINNFTTSNLVEGNNLYYTNVRVFSNIVSYLENAPSIVNPTITGLENLLSNNLTVNNTITGTVSSLSNHTTSNLLEGSNLYFTNTRAVSALTAGQNIVIAANGLITGAVSEFSGNTDIVAEGSTNLYFTNSRAVGAITGNDGIIISSNGLITLDIPPAGLSEFFATGNVLTLVTSGGNLTANLTSTVVVSNTAPAAPFDGQSWVDATTGKKYTWIGDSDSYQWVELDTDGSLSLAIAVQSVNMKGGNVILTTSDIGEGTNLYFTNTRSIGAFVSSSGVAINANGQLTANVISVNGANGVVQLTTLSIPEQSNLYYTDERVYANVSAAFASNIFVSTKANIADLNTSNITEGSNLYFTNTRARQALVTGSGLNLELGNGLISVDSTVATLTGTQTLTNKTLQSPNATTRLFVSSTQNNLPVLEISSNTVNDGVGLVQINGAEPDIIINQFTEYESNNTINFNFNGQSKIAFGRNKDFSFYITRYVGSTWYDNSFVLDYSSGNVSIGSSLQVANTVSASRFIGQLQGTVSSLANHTTSNVTEGNNLYFSNARAIAAVQGVPFSNLNVSFNLNANFIEAPTIRTTTLTGNVIGNVSSISNFSTSNLVEGSNLYFTNTRVYSNVVALNYATISYVDNKVANLVNSAPGALDTLNELANALGNDPNFATSTASLIGSSFSAANVAVLSSNVAITQANVAFNLANSVASLATTASQDATEALETINTKASKGRALALSIIFGG